jgi:GAF domain-containing protein
VPRDSLSVGVEVLQRLVAGADDAEIDALLGQMGEKATGEKRESEFRTFEQQANLLRRGRAENLVAERGLSLLIHTTHDLSKTLELGGLLRTIVARARSLVDAHLAWVTVLDKEIGIFRVVTAEGHLSPAITEMRSPVDIGAVSLIMNSKSFFDTQDYLHDPRFRHAADLDRTFENENIVSLAGFPILSDDEVLGFLFVADRYARKLSGRQISVLGSFALHAGVAMRNANLFSRLSAALHEAERNRSALIDHIRRVEASAAAHDEMTTLLAAGAELHQFLQRLATQIGGAVLLYDADMRIRDELAAGGYDGRIASELKAGTVDAGLLVAANAQSRHTGRSVVVLTREGEHCRAMALHGGTGRSETLLLCHRGELDAIDIRNIERSAVALSIAKLWNEKREAERQIASSTLVRHLALVIPPDAATISAIRDRLSLTADQPIVLCLVAIAKLERAAQTTIVWESATRANLLVDLLDDTYLIAGPEPAVRAFLHNLGERRDGWDAGGIISEPIADLSTTPSRYAQLSRSLRAIRKLRPLCHFVEYAEVSLFARVMESEDAERLARDITRVLRPIDRLPTRQRSELKRTLLTYFDCRHNITRSAAELGLHVNTVRQRLDVLRETIGGWDDPIRALEMHFALRLEAVLDAPPGPG